MYYRPHHVHGHQTFSSHNVQNCFCQSGLAAPSRVLSYVTAWPGTVKHVVEEAIQDPLVRMCPLARWPAVPTLPVVMPNLTAQFRMRPPWTHSRVARETMHCVLHRHTCVQYNCGVKERWCDGVWKKKSSAKMVVYASAVPFRHMAVNIQKLEYCTQLNKWCEQKKKDLFRGCYAQRCRRSPRWWIVLTKWAEACPAIKSNADFCCKLGSGGTYPTHRHYIWTAGDAEFGVTPPLHHQLTFPRLILAFVASLYLDYHYYLHNLRLRLLFSSFRSLGWSRHCGDTFTSF